MNRLQILRPIFSRAGIALLPTILLFIFLRLFGWIFFWHFPLKTLAFLSFWAFFYVVVSGLIWLRRKLYSGSPTRARRLLWRLLIAVPILVVILIVILLVLPFARWSVAAIQCGHAPIETDDFAAANSYTLPSDIHYTHYPILGGFACTMKDVDGRHHSID